jgi:hypothetical protein
LLLDFSRIFSLNLVHNFVLTKICFLKVCKKGSKLFSPNAFSKTFSSTFVS